MTNSSVLATVNRSTVSSQRVWPPHQIRWETHRDRTLNDYTREPPPFQKGVVSP